MKKTERQLWEAADSLLGGQLFLEEEELAPEPMSEPGEEMEDLDVDDIDLPDEDEI